MNQAKLNILKDTFKNRFDISRFQKFTREFFNEPNMLQGLRDERIWLEYKNSISAYYKIASYQDSASNRVLILAVELKKGSSVERARSLQRNFISKILDGSDYEGAIVGFYTPDEINWRLSLVRLDYSLTSKGVELDLTPAKRYSYLVGENEPNHTAQAQLLEIFEDDKHNPTLDEIESAFSVEKVTKDFFNSYKDKYLDLKEYLEENEAFINETKNLGLDNDKFAEQFSKKLMGQLAFLYFLQKKGWLGVRLLPSDKDRMLSAEEFKQIYNSCNQFERSVLVKAFKQDRDRSFKSSSEYLHELSEDEAGILSNCFIDTKYNMPWGIGDRRFIRRLFEFCNNKTDLNFFNDYLEPFFYEALNKKRVNHYYKRFNCKIPFLNGGLFEPIEGYHWKNVKFDIPNDIFSNFNEKGREADGILDVFDRYNFTMNEDEPLDKEVAIDPEMLGKIFENLLDVSDRKSKGAFYTPREIVHYMCQESLINYLVNKVGVPYEDMKEFILYGEIIRDADSRRTVVREGGELTIKPSIYENILAIDEALKNVKVADPAVGSGAFPLGMLNEIVKARNNITEYIVKVNDKGDFGKKYDASFIKARRSEYKMKWDTIKNSIFAVDIEPSAVDIAKLRLWLSVVVDQEIDENNPEPHPLPNLDQNIMVGNSLIDEFEGIKLFDESLLHKDKNSDEAPSNFIMQMNMLLDQSDELLDTMFKLQDRYFGEDDEEKKKEIKIQIDKIRDELIKYKLEKENNTEGLKRYYESLKNKTKPYFIWELEFAKVFKDNGGFDIVIGNPPYIGFHNVHDKDYFKTKYISANGKYDFYVLFIEKGINLLKYKGYISFICPSYFYKRNYGKQIRNIILEQTKIKSIIDFKDSQIFESATTYTCIFGFEKDERNANNEVRIIDNNLDSEKYYKISQKDLSEPAWLLEDGKSMEIVNKIKENSKYTLGKIVKSISQGIVTGNNSVFILDEETIIDRNINFEFLKKVYKGKDIRNGKLNFNNEYVFYPYKINLTGGNILISESDIKTLNPNLYNYLIEKKEELLSRDYFIKSNKLWYELWNPRKANHFISRKLVFPEINDRNDFVLCDECYYSDSACGAELLDEYHNYEKYVVKYLNSSLITELYKKISVPKANGYLIYKNAFLKELPIFIPEEIDLIYSSLINLSDIEFEKWLVKKLELNI
ncbi:hypothetical protein E9840_03455 [Tissierella creatinini]|nr:hypothetical protein E9840_03455 [Tissierella creatinini]TJX63243.1 hypothetical protein E8P77_15435 [Soehngenia saccharolytica]